MINFEKMPRNIDDQNAMLLSDGYCELLEPRQDSQNDCEGL